MKAIGRNLIIQKDKESSTTTKGGLLLAELHREDIRYRKATVLEIGDDISGVKKGDKIFYDKHAGHGIEINKEKLHVIKLQDVVIVL